MARTRHSAEPYSSVAPSLESVFQVSSASFSSHESDFAHALFAPMHYTPGYAYPLIVWLHGRGGDERQLQRVMPLVSMQNYVAVAPRGIEMPDEGEEGRPCHGWLQTEEHIQQAEQRVFDVVDLAGRKFHVSPKRVFLAGFDAGGTMAMRIAMSHPDRFAGVLSLCGAFPSGRTPFCNLVAARRLANPPGDRPREHRVSRRTGLRGFAAPSHGRPVDYLAAVSLRARIDAADARGRGSLDHRADHGAAARAGGTDRRVVARR